MLKYQLNQLKEGVEDMSRSVADGRGRVRALRGAAHRIGGVRGIEDESECDEGSMVGTDDRARATLGMQSLADIKNWLGVWLSSSKSQS